MDKPLFQNIDVDQNNPLTPVESASSPKFKLPKDPKIIALMVMIGLIIILAIIASIISATRKNIPIAKPKTTPTPAVPTITPAEFKNIPTIYLEKFNQIDQEIRTEENFPPPQLNTDIGL